MVLVKATASSSCKLQQLQMHGCGIANMGFIQGAIKLRAEEALANAKGPKKKAKKKKKGGKAKEEPAGEPLSRQHICPIDPCPRSVAQTDLRFECNKSKSMHQICSSIWAVTPADEHNFMSMGLHTLNSGGVSRRDPTQSASGLKDTSGPHCFPNRCHATRCCLIGVIACCLT